MQHFVVFLKFLAAIVSISLFYLSKKHHTLPQKKGGTAMKRISTILIILALTLTFFTPRIHAQPELKVPSAILMEQSTGTILLEQNADEKRAPASVTKVMTLLLIMEALDEGKLTLDQMIPVSPEAAGMGGSQVYLKEGESLSVKEMLKCIAVVSANDCCVAMAEAISGSASAFIEEMNRRAAELGMTNTHFNSCTGLDTENHYTTARDIALMSRALMAHPEITEYTTIWMDSIRNGAFTLSNTNRLVRYYEGATGLKTGFTSTAGYCLSATATRENVSLVAVVLGATTSDERFNDAKALLNYGFSQIAIYDEAPPVPSGVKVLKGTEPFVTPICLKKPSFPVAKGKEKEITYTVQLPETVEAPVEKNQRLGTIEYRLNDEIIGSLDLMAAQEVPRVGFSHLFFKLIQYFFTI